MSINPQTNLEFLSSQNQVKSKKEQMLENLKLEMIKDMKLDDKLVKRDDLVNEISKARENTGFPKQINIGGKIIELKEDGKYKTFITQYKKIHTENPTKKEEILEILDKTLAEELILDKNKMITFEGVKAETEAKESFERLGKNKKYEKKIELIKKIDDKEIRFIIKRTKKQLEEIERAEKVYEELHGTETQEPNQQQPNTQVAQGPNQGVPQIRNISEEEEKLQNELREVGRQLKNIKIGQTIELSPAPGKLIRLQKKDDKGWVCLHNTVEEFKQYIDKNHSIEDEDGNKSYISYINNEDLRKFLNIPKEQKASPLHKEDIITETETEKDNEEIEQKLEAKEITATISDTTKITRAIAEREAGEKLRKIYKNTARYKPWSRPTKLTLFLGRGYMKDHYTRKYIKMKDNMQRDDNLIKGADRHEMELKIAKERNEKINIIEVGLIDEENYPETYKEIQVIADQFEKGNMKKENFQKEFKDIIEDDSLDQNAPATAKAGWKPLKEIRKENDIEQMGSNVVEKIESFKDHKILVAAILNRMNETDDLFDKNCRMDITNYFKKHRLQPGFLKQLNIKLDDKNVIKDIKNNMSHQAALTKIAAQTMRLKVQILAKGEEAYDIKQEKNTMTKIGDRLDKPVSDKSRFGKRLEKHPFAKNAFGTLRGITKLGAMITPAILLAPLGPLAVAGAAGGMAFTKTLFKKYSHYNKEHVGYQRNQAVNVLENRKERDRLMKEVGKMNPASRFFHYYFGLGKTARDVRQFKDYVMTTHDQLKNSKTLAGEIEKLLFKQQLEGSDPKQLENLISQALARLDYHKETGQNFLGSANKDEAEKEYQTIYRLVLTGSMRLDKTLDELKNNRSYKIEKKTINEGTGGKKEVNEIGYKQSRKRFKHRQTEKALVGAAKAGGIAFGLSYLATNLASTKANTEINTHETTVGDNFALGKHELAEDNNVYTQSKDFFSTSDAAGKNIVFQYGGGTDATQVVSGHLTQPEYLQKITEVQTEITNMSNLSVQTKSNLINELQRKPRENIRNEAGFTNDYLHGMRCIEGLEQTAKALNESGANASSITLTPAHNHLTYDIIGTTYDNAGERVVQGGIAYAEKIMTPENIIPIPVPGFANTFQKRNNDEENKSAQDNYGRKTRTPAPKVDKQRKNSDSRRRSGASVEETQFTNANN